MVKFGDPNLSIKRDDPDRLKNFRARHNCDQKQIKQHRDTGHVSFGKKTALFLNF